MIAENTPEFWRSVALDTSVTLTDKLTLEECQKLGEGFGGRMYTVDRILSVADPDGNIHDIQWLFFCLDGSDETLWLMVKIVNDRDLDIRVYTEVESVYGDRDDLVHRSGSEWLFAPLDENEFVEDLSKEDYEELDLCTLSYAATFNLGMTAEDGTDIECEFQMKPQGEFTGKLTDDGDQLVTLVEYECNEDKCQEPDCVLLEVGHFENETGGMVRLMTGNSILPTEIDIL